MKANELRIGNWVDVNGKPCKVESISDDGINYTDETDHYEDESYNYILWCSIFDPIPLTLEILKKSGVSWTANEVEMQDNQIAVSLHLYFEGWNSPALHYVHQLQNLYFCLTGEELNIEL
jgi:hypothetical protein